MQCTGTLLVLGELLVLSKTLVEKMDSSLIVLDLHTLVSCTQLLRLASADSERFRYADRLGRSWRTIFFYDS